MKKQHILLIVGVLLVGIIGGSIWFWCAQSTKELAPDVLASVNGVNISEQQVQERIKINQINNQVYADYLTNTIADGETLSSYLANSIRSTEKKAVVQELVKAEVLRQDLAKKGIALTQEQTRQMWDSEFQALQTQEAQKGLYDGLQKSLQSFPMETEDYVQLSYSLAYDTYNIAKAKQTFTGSKAYHEDFILTADNQFELYTYQLMQKAKIQTIETVGQSS